MLILSREDIQFVLTMEDAIKAVEEGFRQFALGNVRMPVRSSVTVGKHKGLMLTMPAYIGGDIDALGQKVVTIYHDNPMKHNLPTILATVQVLDPKTGNCLAVMDGAFLTALRTGAASGAATKHLARSDAKRVGLFGAGVQAETQLEAVSEVRKIELVSVFDPMTERVMAYCRRMSEKLGIAAEPTKDPHETVRDADIIICASTSRTPVFNGEWLKAGTHINGIGSHTPDSRELDTATIRRSKVVVDSREAALKEAGDLLIPIEENAISSQHIWAELGEIILGKKEGRTSSQEITLFKSVGLALQDVSIAAVAYRRAVQRHKGVEVAI